MVDLPFGKSAYSRERGNLPDLPVVNMFAEAAPNEKGGVTLQSRPGLVEVATLGAGPIRGVFQADGVVNGERFVVSGAEVYRGAKLIGVISGDGPVSFAASPTELLINAGAKVHRTTGDAVAPVVLPDNVDASAIAFVAGRFIAIERGSQKWYFSAVLDGTSWDGLDFANAENEPDQLLDVAVIDDVLVLIGAASVEFWPKTGDAALPFAPISGKVFDKGAMATGCTVPHDNTFAYLTRDGLVCLAGNVPTRVSDAGIEERIARSISYALWGFSFEGHDFIVLRLSQGSWLRDAQTQQWCEFASWGRDNWRCACAGVGVFGDDQTGKLWRFDGHADDGGVLERRFRAVAPLSGGTVSCDNLRLTTNPGHTITLAGEYADPVAEMRSSRDRGQRWTPWRKASLGQQGYYRTRVEWRRNGRFDDPGGLFEFRVTDPVPFGASNVAMNEPGGGRARNA